MKLSKTQFKTLVKSCLEEVHSIDESPGKKWWNVSLDRPGAGWSELVQADSEEEAKKIANKKHPNEPPADTVWQSPAPQKNHPGSDPDKWQAISGMDKQTSVPSADIKKFAMEILEKIKERQRKKGFGDMNIGEAIRQMIEHKMTKEGWSKGTLKEGVGGFTVNKSGKEIDKGDVSQFTPDVTTTSYDIMYRGKKVGELRRDNYMGIISGNLFGKNLPDLTNYGSGKGSAPLSSLHSFLKSKTGKDWMARVNPELSEGKMKDVAIEMSDMSVKKLQDLIKRKDPKARVILDYLNGLMDKNPRPGHGATVSDDEMNAMFPSDDPRLAPLTPHNKSKNFKEGIGGRPPGRTEDDNIDDMIYDILQWVTKDPHMYKKMVDKMEQAGIFINVDHPKTRHDTGND